MMKCAPRAETRRRRADARDGRRIAALGIASTAVIRRAQAISWPQTAYVGNDTKTACLPTLREDLWAILDDALPGCATKQLNQLAVNRVRVFGRRTDRGKREVGHTVQQTPALCSVVNEVYADDVRLWRSRCGARA